MSLGKLNLILKRFKEKSIVPLNLNFFRYILHYQDHLTKLSVLRPLESKRAKEVATRLYEIFCLITPPCILQSDNGREFTANCIEELKCLWPDLVIVHGQPRHPQSQGSVERANADIKDMLACWCRDNNSAKWSFGLHMVQLQKNNSHHRTLGCKPLEAAFGRKRPFGLQTIVPPSLLQEKALETEEELQQILGVK